ncbi:MAG: isochorismate synthase [Candidatus Nanopelagicales bacterium]
MSQGLLGLLPRGPGYAWVRDGAGFVAWGEADRFTTSGPERFSRAQRWWSDWCANAGIEDEVGSRGTGPVAFASFTFDNGPQDSVVVVPAVTVGRRDGHTWLTTVEDDGLRLFPDDSRVATASEPGGVPAVPVVTNWRTGSRTIEQWAQIVATAVTRINAGELDKVVLARDIVAELAAPLDLAGLLTALSQRHPQCWTFSVDGLIGATPELLVRRSGQRVLSRVLAGTVRRNGDDGTDAGLAAELLGSDKDLEEHEYAVGSVAEALAAHCTDLDVPAEPSVLALANVQHLATDVTGELAAGASALALAASLHPTAAVCGTPTERALSVIREFEGLDRGRYAGPVGWLDAYGDGEFGIALRCAQVETGPAGPESVLRLYAGCGIVAGSVPELEIAESEAKFDAVRGVLGAAG